MTNLTPISSEDDLKKGKKIGAHRRSESRDDTVNHLICCALWVLFGAFVCFTVGFLFLYLEFLFYPKQANPQVIEKIEQITTYVFAIAGGYLAHFMQRNIQE